ncbi:MAG TPA: radical SAM/SPASM domain-containing protein, partial [Vicinamibacterales bacterium]
MLLRGYLARPDEIDIEVTSGCDADCIMCPRRAMRRTPGPMAMPLFRKIVDEAIALGVRDLVLNGYGEIATLRNAREYLAYIRERSRSVRILVNTNGMRMDEDLAAAFIEFGVDVVNVAIDGATAETFERIRKHLKLETVEANVRRLLAMRNASRRNRPFVMVHMILQPENEHETDLFLAKWSGVADHAGFAGMLSRAGGVPVKIRNLPSETFPCFLLWRQMPVLSDGTVAMCCDDWDGRAALGNLNTHSVREVWQQSEQRRAVRALHLEGRRDAIDLCAGCEAPRRPPWWFPAQP